MKVNEASTAPIPNILREYFVLKNCDFYKAEKEKRDRSVSRLNMAASSIHLQ